uniref:FAR1 domain-containing protein n=1 Tax=Ananas comosus var. bracteatus TaxID=296719 RepID=A0A6V7NZ23_ANACO|nr:unnamed protein product [Ananas comosus var. bracteatus]
MHLLPPPSPSYRSTHHHLLTSPGNTAPNLHERSTAKSEQGDSLPSLSPLRARAGYTCGLRMRASGSSPPQAATPPLAAPHQHPSPQLPFSSPCGPACWPPAPAPPPKPAPHLFLQQSTMHIPSSPVAPARWQPAPPPTPEAGVFEKFSSSLLLPYPPSSAFISPFWTTNFGALAWNNNNSLTVGFRDLLRMDITSSNNPTCDGNSRSRVASSSFEVDEGVIESSSLMILNSCESSDHISEKEPIDQLDQENWNQQIGQMEIENDEPYVGQVFSSIDEAKRFYNIYAFKIGFSIRKATHYKAKRLDGLVTSITYTCSKEGHAKPPTQRKKQKKFLKLIELLRRSFQIGE